MILFRKAFSVILFLLLGFFIIFDFFITGNSKMKTIPHPALLMDISSRTDAPSVVGIANSRDSLLGDLKAPVDQELTYTQIDSITRLAVRRAGGLGELIEPDDWVVLKVNMVSFSIEGAATDLRVVKSLIQQLIEEGDADTITIAEGGAWDKNTANPNGWTKTWSQYDNLSYQEMITNFNNEYTDIFFDIVDLNYADVIEMEVPGGGLADEKWTIPKIVVNCDKFISVPVVKTHHRPGITLSHKNYVGIAPTSVYYDPWSGTSKFAPEPGMAGIYHGHDRIEHVIVDLFSYHPADLTVAECFLGMEGKGPTSGDPIRRNYVLASTDPVALDAVGAMATGHNPKDIKHLVLSHNKGYGNIEMEDISIVGQSIEDIYYEFKKAEHEGEPTDRYCVHIDGKPAYYGRANRTWLINGKYDGSDLAEDFLNGETKISPSAGDVTAGNTWKKFTSVHEYIDLKSYWGDNYNQSITYAYTEIISDSAQSAYLRFGADDGIKIWLNGEEIYTNGNMGTFNLVEENIPVNLNKGKNDLLLKILNKTNNYEFAVSISEEDGDTPPGIQYNINTNTEVVQTSKKPLNFNLKQNYPNPFNPITNITFSLQKSENITLTVYDLQGQKVETLYQGNRPAGEHSIKFNGANYTSGMYFYKLQTSNDQSLTKKMILIK